MSWLHLDLETPKQRGTSTEEVAEAEAAHADRMRSIREESQRLAKLRSDVASGLLAVSKAAERDARRLLSLENHADAAAREESLDGDRQARSRGVEAAGGLSRWVGRRGYAMFVAGVACGFGLAMLSPFNRAVSPPNPSVGVSEPGQTSPTLNQPPPASEEPVTVASRQPPREEATPTEETEGTQPSASQRPEQATVANPLESAPSSSSEQPDGLRVTLLATGESWVFVTVDGDEAWDRLMSPGQTVVVDAETQVVVRVGDAGALSILVNDRPLKPLGTDGQVVTLRITPANYRTFLLDAPASPSPGRTSAPATSIASGLRLTLQAKERCWVRVQLDGAEGWERLLAPDETIEVDALDEAVVRVGNAAALSLWINDEPVKPLGAPGQVTTLHVTRSNYQTFLATVPSDGAS